MDEIAVRRALRAWLVQRGNVTDSELRDNSPLVSEGIINSLDVIELIVFLEGLSGKAVNMESLRGDEFRDIDTLMDSFVKVPV